MKTKSITVIFFLIYLSSSTSFAQLSRTISCLPGIRSDTQNLKVDTRYTTDTTMLIKSTELLPAATESYANTDVRVHPSSVEQSEVHISISHNDPSNIIISANTHPGVSEQGYYVSNNCASSWTGGDALLHSYTVAGDPSTAIDANGNMYIATITEYLDGYYIQKSTDNGVHWSTLIRGTTEADFDKEMIAVDDLPSSPYVNNLYCAWSIIHLSGVNNTVNFNRSTDGGQNFSQPIIIHNGSGQGTNVQTGINGQVYVCWANFSTNKYPADGIGFTYSTNGGVSFSTAKVAFSISGIATSGGQNSTFNYIAVNDFPSMAVDKSNSSYKGRIYIVYTTKENGNGKAIIQIRYSNNNGSTWSPAHTISIASGRQNFFPWISVDPVTGIVCVVYYSFDSSSGFSTNIYLAYSYDGSTNFTNLRVSDVSHITAPINNSIHRSGYAGDYIGVASYGSVAYPAWMDNRSGTWQVYMDKVPLMYVTGPSIVCSSGATYTVNYLSPGYTVNWSYSSNLTPYYGGSNFIAVKPHGAGSGWVQANVNGTCGSLGNFRFNISRVGIIGSFTGPSWIALNTNGTFTSSASCGPGPYTYRWWIRQDNGQGSYVIGTTQNLFLRCVSSPNALSVTGTSGNNSVVPDIPINPQVYYLSMEVMDVNGFSYTTGEHVVSAGGYLVNAIDGPVYLAPTITLTPNPADNSVQVTIEDAKNNIQVSDTAGIVQTALNNESKKYRIGIYSSFGIEVYSTSKIGTNFYLPTGNLNNGNYIVEIIDGKNVYRKQLLVKH